MSNNMEYVQAYTEVYCLLKYFPKKYINKLPNKLLTMLEEKSNERYNIIVDPTKDLESQNISKKTKNVLAVLKYNYWSDDIEKEHLRKKFYENEKIYKEELYKKYNPDNLFADRKKSLETTENTENIESSEDENLALIKHKESFFSKILNKIKQIFSR